jgi:hypothetical protein
MPRVVIRRAREATVEKWVVAAAKALGVGSIKLYGVAYGGWPDRIFLVPGGKPLFVEFKAPGGEPTERQRAIHARLREAGYAVEVHDDRDAAVESIRRAAAVGSEQGPGKGDEVPPGARRRRPVRRSRLS